MFLAHVFLMHPISLVRVTIDVITRLRRVHFVDTFVVENCVVCTTALLESGLVFLETRTMILRSENCHDHDERGEWMFGETAPGGAKPVSADAYEIGSIVVTRLPPWVAPATRALLRGDDLGKKISELAGVTGAPWGGALLAILLGVAWAFLTYGLGSAVARALGQGPVRPSASPSPSPERR